MRPATTTPVRGRAEALLGTALAAAACMIGLLLPWQARADGIWADCLRSVIDSSTVYQFVEGATVNLSRDTEVGQPHGPWLRSNAPAAWRCTPRSTQLNVAYQIAIQAYSPYARESLIQHEGVTYGSYLTNNLNVNYIGRWRYTINGEVTDWTPLTEAAGIYKTPPLISMIHSTTAPFDIGVETQIKLVRRNQATIASGTGLTIFDPFYVRPYQTSGGTTFLSGQYRITQVRGGTVVVVKDGTCTTPDVVVELPDARANEFHGVGSTAARKEFELNFQNCPAGFGGISYRFSPTTSVLDAANGVVALGSGSTASGVGVQFLHGDTQPLQFETAYQVDEYDTAMGGSYSVPMAAGLYQTAPEVTPGTAGSAITFTLNYR
ncbi:fimbrial protein [Diaphorobacter ruginosibacter]|uniref:fimbrial protein n=1 Tax=Diaphorobacter ruginosibacter TaxID=1715720 RepID=UPI0033406409